MPSSTAFLVTICKSDDEHIRAASRHGAAGRLAGRRNAGPTSLAGHARGPPWAHRKAGAASQGGLVEGRPRPRPHLDLHVLWPARGLRRLLRMARRPREARRSLFLRDHRTVRPSRRHRDADGDPPGHARDRGRQHPLFAGVAAHAARNRGAVPARALRPRDARVPARRMEVQCPQRTVAPGRLALRLRLRRHVPATHDHHEPQPRHGVLLHPRQRMAGAQGCLRARARAGEFRREGTAAGKLERIERRALDSATPLQGADDVHVLITGAAGMIGRKLTERLGKDGALAGKPIDKLGLLDVVCPAKPDTSKGKIETVAADLAAPGEAAKAIADRPEVIFHLAGVVSGEAELDFDKGYRVNLDGTRALLEAIRATGDGYRPRLVYTSSIAVFGAPFPPSIPDDFHLTPLTSYGTQKTIGEALIADYTRRGFCDGVGIRLPSIVVRPGKP